MYRSNNKNNSNTNTTIPTTKTTTTTTTTTGLVIPSLPDKAIDNFVGNGIRCNYNNNNIFVGNRNFM